MRKSAMDLNGGDGIGKKSDEGIQIGDSACNGTIKHCFIPHFFPENRFSYGCAEYYLS